jgi:spore maturation protein CgeB
MRFFEVPACGGLALNSSCPEMEPMFVQGESGCYYQTDEELLPVVQRLLGNPTELQRISEAAHRKVVEAHTYSHRARDILRELGT